MKNVTVEEILKIASLSNLDLTPQEAENLLGPITNILRYAARIQEVAALPEENGAPRTNANVLRKDEIAADNNAAAIMAQVPQHMQNFIVVPHILEGN